MGIYKLCMKSYKTMKIVGAWNKEKLLSATEIWNNNEQNRKGCLWNNVKMKITIAKNEDVYRQKKQMQRK